MAKEEVMLTTIDNEVNPFDDYTKWHIRDTCDLHHYTSERLAEIAHTYDGMSEEDYNEEMERAMDELIKFDFENIFVKVRKEPN